MRVSNKLAVKWCLEHGIDDIWLKPHGKRTDTHYCKRGNYRALDLFGLFDGIAWFDRKIVFLQIKTNKWASEKPFRHFLKDRDCFILSINVCKSKNSKIWKVKNRFYQTLIPHYDSDNGIWCPQIYGKNTPDLSIGFKD